MILHKSQESDEYLMHSKPITKNRPVCRMTPSPENQRNFISSSTHLSFNCCRCMTPFDWQHAVCTRRAETIIPMAIKNNISPHNGLLEKFSIVTCTLKYTIVISKIAKPQAKETADDVLPSEVPSSVGFPKLRGFSNKKLMMNESLLFIWIVILLKTTREVDFTYRIMFAKFCMHEDDFVSIIYLNFKYCFKMVSLIYQYQL